MKIVVTGGIGNVGSATVQRLVSHGHQVKILDRRSEGAIPGAELVRCDITDYMSLTDQFTGQDAVIHLAGLPYPGAGTGPEIFRINCSGTYNVFEAAAKSGIRRVVCASSINAFGFNFGIKPFPIRYFPIDEDHPGVTTDPYSFSKQVLEDIAAYYWRRDRISSICFRLPWVYQKSLVDMWMGKDYFTNYRDQFNSMLALPNPEREQKMQELIAWHNDLRSQRIFEKSWENESEETPDFMNGADSKMLMFFGWTDFWAVISAEDSAQAFEKAVTTSYDGSHAFYVHEKLNSVGLPAEELAKVFYPEVKARKRPLEDAECLVDMSRVQQLIGYEPEFSLIELVKEK